MMGSPKSPRNSCLWSNRPQVDIVPTKIVDAVFSQYFGGHLERLGFDQITERRRVRSDKAPVGELFDIQARKGVQYVPRWGFSLDFVPIYLDNR
jgi:hypothetical protein